MRKQKKNSKVRVQFRRAIKELETIQKNIEALPEKVLDIVKDGQYIAQNTLAAAVADPNFTQEKVSMPHMLDCIVIQQTGTKNSVKYRLVVRPTDEKTNWNMYFAEYGAGLARDNRATSYWDYANLQVALTGKKHKSWNSKSHKGYWYFKDYHGEIHMVNTSTKVKYMQAGVEHIRRELKELTNSVDLKNE